MENRPAFQRNVEDGQVSYDVLSSKGNRYYSVIMLNAVALSCNCRAGQFNQPCKHKTLAEREEKKLKEPEKLAQPLSKVEIAPLNNRNKGFSVLRK